jgi:chemotaxis protein methyltransferase WspC
MNLSPVIDQLQGRIGLDPNSLGATTLSRVVAARMRALGVTAPEAYAARLAVDMREFQLLLEDIVVPETWFFRGGEIFAFLAGHVADVVRQRKLATKFRILSVPCSTGEEPFSLAIALDEAGVAPGSWEIEAVDLSTGHIESARKARYREFSFRETTLEWRARYFQPVEGVWELAAGIRSRVRFRQGNLLDPLFLPGEGLFHLILCRNLFIYLHPDARRQALNTVARLLARDGWLCTGHADPLDSHDSRFVRTGREGYFLYRRTAPVENSAPALSKPRETHSAERGAPNAPHPTRGA